MSDFENEFKGLNQELESLISKDTSNHWPIFSKRFVAFMDLAGFTKTSKYLYYSYSLLDIIKQIVDVRGKNCVADDGTEYLKIIAISDSVIVLSRDDSPTSFCCFCHAVGIIFNTCIVFHRMATVAMSFGEIAVDKSKQVFCGEAYNKAYKLQESMDYYGILCDSSISDYIENNNKCGVDGFELYKDMFYQIEYYIKLQEQRKLKIEPCKNFMWYNRLLFGDVVYTQVEWGHEKKAICEIDGIVSGSYEQIIAEIIESYADGAPDKIKKRMNNTMNVIELMLTYQIENQKCKFKRYQIDNK